MTYRGALRKRLLVAVLIVAQLAGLLPGFAGGFSQPAMASTPQAGLGDRDRILAELATAEAVLREAEQRLAQARAGQGGAGARPEDIVAAEAALMAARVALRLHQPFDDVRFLQGPILLFDGLERAAGKLRDACDDIELESDLDIEDNEVAELRTELDCPDDLEDAMQSEAATMANLRVRAELELKRWTQPAPTILNYYAPYEQEVRKAELEVQELRSGGERDQARLELDLALAQADVDSLRALLNGSVQSGLQAQLQGARAMQRYAEYRLEQARNGQGGADARSEDLGKAEADVRTAEAELGLLLKPLEEEVGQALAVVQAGQMTVRKFRNLRDSCGDVKLTIKVTDWQEGIGLEILSESVQLPAPGLPPPLQLPPIRLDRQRGRFSEEIGEIRDGVDRIRDRLQPIGENRGRLKGNLDEILRLLRLIEAGGGRIRERLEEIRARLAEIEEEVRAKLEGIGDTLDRIADRLDDIERKLDEIQDDLDDLRVKIDGSCSGDERRVVESQLERAEGLVTVAEQKYKLLTDPTVPQILHLIEPKKQAVVAAQTRLEKLKTGGSQDLASLELELARAQARVEGLEAVLADSPSGSLQARLAGSPGGLYRAQLRAAQAAQTEAEYRLQQAATGLGGVGAKPEDIAAAQAELIARQEELLQILDLQPELLVAARANLEAAQAQVKEARYRRESCNAPVSENTVEVDGDEIGEKTFMRTSCSDDLEEALDFAINVAQAEQSVAEVTLSSFIAPSEKLIRNLVVPRQQAIAAATARLQKLKTGGSFDQTTLELHAELARAEVAFWTAALSGQPRAQIEAQLQAALALQREAEVRLEQAHTGQGGADARPEDLAIAEAELATAQTKLQEIVDPTPEAILTAQAQVQRAEAALAESKKRREACDDPRIVGVKESDNEDQDNEPDERTVTTVHCPSGRTRELAAASDKAAAELVSAQQGLKLLTDPAQPEIGYVVGPYQQAVVAAEAKLRKLKTGGSRDEAMLQLNLALAQAEADRLRAVLNADEEGELRARLAAAAARLREAQFRQQQAQAGQGGADARPEDLAMAKAELDTALANLMALLHPLQEKVQQARSGVDAARADLRAAEGRRDACGEEKTHTVVKVEGQEEERETVTDPNCSDNRKEAAEAGIEVAARKRDIAEQQLQLLTNPAQPQILYVVAPLAEAATAAGAKLQKLATGGSRDQQTLDLAVAVAQSEVDRWQAALDHRLAGAATARLAAGRAELASAEARQAQAAAGQGGVLARGEDIAIAESELKASQAELQTALDPPREVVQSARLGIAVVDESVREMKALREACGDFRGETTIEDSDADYSDNNSDNSNDNEGLDLTLDTRFKCPDDLKDVYEAIAEGLEGSRLVPVAALSLLTEVATNEKLQVLVAGLKAKVVEAEQYLAKVRTGGAVDATTLERDVAAAHGVLECRQAVLAGANAGELFRQESPFAWTDPDPCALRQLPGKLPPFSELDVRISSRSARPARIEE